MNVSYSLRPDQLRAVEEAEAHLRGERTPKVRSLLLRSPTGSGKSYIEAELLKRLGPTHVQIVPSIEIAMGIARKLTDFDFTTATSTAQRRETERLNIFTAGVYKNRLLKGEVRLPSTIAFDEAHHTTADTNENIWDLIGKKPRVGPTATTYRGTPEGTRELLDAWDNNVYEVISLADSVRLGLVSLPTFNVWPLLNDDLIKIVNGEFHVATVNSMAKDKMGDLVERIKPMYDGSHYDRPTMLAFSSVQQVLYAEAVFAKAGLPCIAVTGETLGRQAIFQQIVDRTHVLLQIKVVGEGVDLPIRRLIDLAPTLSPVAWMQLVGRIMRPVGTNEPQPEYIACCHNLTRHVYLFHGLIPADSVKKAQIAWGEDFKPTRRGMARAIGLEGFGRFLPASVPLAGGLTGSFYGLQSKNGDEQWGVFMHPVTPTPLYFYRKNQWFEGDQHVLKRLPDGREIVGRKRKYVPWSLIQSMPEIEGCVSLAPTPLTPGQQYKWKKDAKRYGLDVDAAVNAKQFQILPCLMDAGLRIKEL